MNDINILLQTENIMRITRCFLFALLLMAAPAASAQNALRNDPGYVDMTTFEGWFDEEAMIEVNIEGPLLELVAEASRESNPDLADLLDRLKAVYVRGFETEEGPEALQDRMRAFGRSLEDRGWQTVVRVREDEEYVNMHLNVRDGAIMGLMVMVTDDFDDETIFVNIVGDIDPKQIGRIGRAFDIDPLEDLDVN